MINRKAHISNIIQIFKNKVPAVAILGPRQCGKTTLAYQLMKTHPQSVRFDLEDPLDIARLENPMLAMKDLEGLIVIDEIQRRPDLFPILRVLIDRQQRNSKFLILGSASRELIRQSSETLAGRIAYYELSGFFQDELDASNQSKLWFRGGFPRSLLAPSNKASHEWRRHFISTYLEQDIPQLGITIPSRTLRKFWEMVAHYHAQIWNASEIARSFGVSDTTVKRYLDILTSTFMIRQLQPWHENYGKRIVKSPKIYFRDSGIFHALINVESKESLSKHPKLGASWEGHALEQLFWHLGAPSDCFYFWRTHTGAEIDLLYIQDNQKYGFEFKYTDQPKITKSMRSCLETLNLKHLWIIYPGDKSFPLDKKVTASSIADIPLHISSRGGTTQS